MVDNYFPAHRKSEDGGEGWNRRIGKEKKKD